MSKIAKGIKKVFKGAVKVVKKIAKPLAIAAAIYLTGGLALGAFPTIGAGISSIASGVGSVFSAVGTTVANAASAIGSAFGLGTSATAGGAMAGLGPLSNAAYATATGVSTSGLAGLGGAAAAGYSGAIAGGTALTAKTGIMATLGKALTGMTKSTVGQLAIAQGIMGGIQSYAAAKETERQEKRYDSEYVWGAQRRGGDGSNVIDDFQLPELPTSGPGRPPTPTEWRATQPQYANAEEEQPETMAFRNPLIPRRRTVPGMNQSDSDLFLPMGNQNSILYG